MPKIKELEFKDGIWIGAVTGINPKSTQLPAFDVTLHGEPVDATELTGTPQANDMRLHVTIPSSAVGAGVHSFLVTDCETSEVLERFVLIGGTLADQDLRAEVDLLQAELDLLKRAFRRHCAET